MANLARVGRLVQGKTALFVCDIQDKFRPVIFGMPAVIDTAKRMVRAAQLLEVPVLATEQYPKALGSTVSELQEIMQPSCKVLPKTLFSMYTPEAQEWLRAQKDGGIKQVLLCGIEAHVCVLQTAQDLIAHELEVHVLVDGVSSQRPADRAVALARLAQSGAFLTTSESALFNLMADAKHPSFRAVSALVKEERPEMLPAAVASL